MLPTMASTHSCMILLYHIVNEKSSTILLISYRTVVWRDEDTKSHRGIAPTMAPAQSCMILLYHIAGEKSSTILLISLAIQQ